MRPLIRTSLSLAFFAAATAAVAQTAPTAPPAGDFYPLKTGSKWTYKVGETTITVKASASDADGTTLDTEVNGKAVASETIKVSPEGVFRTRINKAKIEPPVQILKLSGGKATKGDKWKVDSTIQTAKVTGEFVVKDDAEKVKVPAGPNGEFPNAICVEGNDFDIAGTKTTVKYWFVAGKGVVKLMYNIQGNEAVLELKEFAEGK